MSHPREDFCECCTCGCQWGVSSNISDGQRRGPALGEHPAAPRCPPAPLVVRMTPLAARSSLADPPGYQSQTCVAAVGTKWPQPLVQRRCKPRLASGRMGGGRDQPSRASERGGAIVLAHRSCSCRRTGEETMVGHPLPQDVVMQKPNRTTPKSLSPVYRSPADGPAARRKATPAM